MSPTNVAESCKRHTASTIQYKTRLYAFVGFITEFNHLMHGYASFKISI